MAGVAVVVVVKKEKCCQVVEMAQEKDMVITSVEDIVCYKAGNFEVPSFLERPGTL